MWRTNSLSWLDGGGGKQSRPMQLLNQSFVMHVPLLHFVSSHSHETTIHRINQHAWHRCHFGLVVRASSTLSSQIPFTHHPPSTPPVQRSREDWDDSGRYNSLFWDSKSNVELRFDFPYKNAFAHSSADFQSASMSPVSTCICSKVTNTWYYQETTYHVHNNVMEGWLGLSCHFRICYD